MGNSFKLSIVALWALIIAVPSFGSTISGASDLIGTTFTVAGANSVQKGDELVGMTGIVTFAGGSTANCTFVVNGDGDGECSSLSAFSVVVNPGNSQTASADWIVTNLSQTLSIASLSLNGIYASSAPVGQQLTAFNPDVVAGHPTANSTCGSTPTTGFGNCRSAGDTPGGTTTATAAVQYSNALHLANNPINMDLWGTITLTFTPNQFTSNQVFQFKIDTDGLTSAVADPAVAPEPGTLGMAGLALALIAFRLRRRTS